MTSDQDQPTAAEESPVHEPEKPPVATADESPTDEPEEAPVATADESPADEPAVDPPAEAAVATADGDSTTTVEQPTTPGRADDAPAPLEEEPTNEADGEAPGSRRSVFVGLSLLAVVLVGILIAVLATGGGGGPPNASSTPTTQAATTGPTFPLAAFTSFHDNATAFTMLYPTTWRQLQSPVAETRLVVSPTLGGEVVSVSVSDMQQVTTPENLANVKAVTDGDIASVPTAKILKTAAITLNGMIGYYYLYTFQDGASGLEGVHAHYFLFHGHRMYRIVFQVLPTDKFSQFAGLFDQMAQSFKVDPDGPLTPVPTSAP